MSCLVSLVSQRVLLICGGMLGWLIVILITDKLQNQGPLQSLMWSGLVAETESELNIVSVIYNVGQKC